MNDNGVSSGPSFVVYVNVRDKSAGIILDQVDAELLDLIEKYGSISKASKELGVSYRAAWERIKGIEKKLGRNVIERKVGGKGGGGAILTGEGKNLLATFKRASKYLHDVLEDRDFWVHSSYKLSARNRLRAKITKISKGDVISKISMELLGRETLTSIISTEAVDELGLREGDEVEAVIKATEVIIAKR